MKANFETGLKICSKCRRELPLSSFGKDIHQPDGLEYSCKECSLKRRRDYLKTKRTKEEIFQTRANLEKGTKICSKCRREFSLDHFHKCKNSYDGFGGQCIFCERAYRELGRNKETQEKWKEENKEKIREWRLSERGKAASRRAYLKAKSSGRLQKWEKKKRKEDFMFKIVRLLRGRVYYAFRAQKEIKSDHTLSLLGCSIEEFRKHIESQFQEGMTWENQGRNGWELDHIIPYSYFDLSDPEQQRICFNYRNLQPLWKLENKQKFLIMSKN